MADWTPLSFNLEYCHDQSQSSLFSTIPPEIRTLIFNFALLDYEDLTDPYPQFAPYYRLGHRGRIRSDTGLLSTCRLIFLETRELPLRLATFTFWKWDEAEYGGPLAYNGRPFCSFLKLLTSRNSPAKWSRLWRSRTRRSLWLKKTSAFPAPASPEDSNNCRHLLDHGVGLVVRVLAQITRLQSNAYHHLFWRPGILPNPYKRPPHRHPGLLYPSTLPPPPQQRPCCHR